MPNIVTHLDAWYLALADRVHYAGVNAGSECFIRIDCLFDNARSVAGGMLLICMGCHAGQGFGISRALAADAVLRGAEAYRTPSAWMRVKGLCWHPLLHKLLHHRYCIRQWREQVHLVDTVPLARECLILLERLRTQIASADRLEEGQHSDAVRQLLTLADAVLGVLDDIAVVLGSGDQKA